MTAAVTMAARERTFFGEPRGLAYLSFTEAWERFSYYGMTALLVLYMTQQLLLPGHVEHIAGFPAFRVTLESVFGPMTTLALASQIMGLYTGFVYFTPVLGGIVADRIIGRRTAVIMGAIMMSAGHLAMAFDQSFLLALLLLISGCGLLKGNISTQVGELYDDSDGEGRTRGFAIFSMAINFGAFVGPLLCGLLAQVYGWHAGFGLAAALMLIGLLTYISGFKYLADKPRSMAEAAPKAEVEKHEWRVVAALGVVAFMTIFQSIGYYQNTNLGLIWINEHVDLNLFGFRVPVSWFNSIDALASIVGVPFLVALWTWQDRRGGEPSDLVKIGIGAWITVAANGLLAIAALTTPRVSVIFPILYDILLGIGFLYYWPVLLALVSRTAPAKLKATLMGAVFLTLFIANFIIGYIGGFYERMSPAACWGMEAAISAVGGVLALVLALPLKRALRIK
ncbi:MAG: peptide MFS transporter [Proteobacteria bacterium]|nr:peptide MFS transporter [Pseudomonadota bacterium]